MADRLSKSTPALSLSDRSATETLPPLPSSPHAAGGGLSVSRSVGDLVGVSAKQLPGAPPLPSPSPLQLQSQPPADPGACLTDAGPPDLDKLRALTTDQLATLVVEAHATITSLKLTLAEKEGDSKAHDEKVTSLKALHTDQLARKNAVIDIMRVKLHRLDFATKEAILFLGKVLAMSAQGDNGRPGGAAGTHQGTAGAHSSPTQGGNATASNRPGAVFEDRILAPGRDQTGSSTAGGSNLRGSGSSEERGAGGGHGSRLDSKQYNDVQSSERIRLAWNYLKQAQASVGNILDVARLRPGVPALLCNLPRLNPEGEVEMAFEAESTSEEDEDAPLAHIAKNNGDAQLAKKDTENDLDKSQMKGGGLGSEKRQYQSTSSSTHQKPKSARATAPASASDVGDNEAGDLADHTGPRMESRAVTGPPSSQALAKHPASSAPYQSWTPGQRGTVSAQNCPNCRTHMLEIDRLNDTVKDLQQDLASTTTQLGEVETDREQVQLAKDILEQEIEELTAQLFDQANRMVIEEAKMREELEVTNRDLSGQLKDMVRKCAGREEELHEMKRCLHALEGARKRSGSVTVSPIASPRRMSNPRRTSLGSAAIIASVGMRNRLDFPVAADAGNVHFIDGIIFTEFQEHIKQTVGSSSLPYDPILNHSTKFLKRCLVEDVEPCLHYGLSYAASSGTIFKFTAGSGAASTFRKKLLEHVVKASLEITPFNQEARQSPAQQSVGTLGGSTNSQNSQLDQVPRAKCPSCNATRDCHFRMRLLSTPQTSTQPSTESAPWEPICRPCRDRISAAIDFYVFVSHLRAGLIGPGKAGATILGMFRHALWLRRRMAMARVGSSGLFEGEVMSQVALEIGISGGLKDMIEWEKLVSIVH